MGEVKSDFHAGRILLKNMRLNSDIVAQIDGVTGEKETYGSVLSRSIKLARCLRKSGFKPGDVLAISGVNHFDIRIPFFSALFNGLPLVCIDPYYKHDEIKTVLKLSSPKVVFCDEDFYKTYYTVIKELGLDTKIITFGEEEHSMKQFIEMYEDDEPDDSFRALEFDVNKIYSFLISTSGTTGNVKLAAFTHKLIVSKMAELMTTERPKGIKVLSISPINWVSTYFMTIAAGMIGQTLVLSSVPDNLDVIINIINKYKSLLREGALLVDAYGQTETLGPVVKGLPGTPVGSCGQAYDTYILKLIDPDTGDEITQPNISGELIVKGPSLSEYYNDPEETAKLFTEDGFYRTGDLFYKDENDYFYFVDRIKTLIKCRNYQIVPVELEEVIRNHEDVSDVCVVGIEDREDGQRPVACVVRRKNCVTAQEIKQLVADKLSKHKALSGGVIFLNEFPMTSTGKVARKTLLDIVKNAKRE
ncbi:luciferin 4-monooxygenase-like isoform X2 [Pieris napi]|uniref:luciferin 4-monooxygenase-like isoform X2 n=1 Tax=Pieris napi TaxID=78633 RepID=UPI001FBAD9AA|nr:luciferin 4-monooxygenase-like isoform X2 [Pieris napi]